MFELILYSRPLDFQGSAVCLCANSWAAVRMCTPKAVLGRYRKQHLRNLSHGNGLDNQGSFSNEEAEFSVGFHRTTHPSIVAIIHDGCNGTRLIERKLNFEELIGLPHDRLHPQR